MMVMLMMIMMIIGSYGSCGAGQYGRHGVGKVDYVLVYFEARDREMGHYEVREVWNSCKWKD